MGEYFPFIHFVSIVAIPFMYWVACIELGVYNSNENQFTLTFGQVSIISLQNWSVRITDFLLTLAGSRRFRCHPTVRSSVQACAPPILLVLRPYVASTDRRRPSEITTPFLR